MDVPVWLTRWPAVICGPDAASWKGCGLPAATTGATSCGGRPKILASGGGSAGTISERSSSETRQAQNFAFGAGTRFDITTENQPSPDPAANSRSSLLTWRTFASTVNSSTEGMIEVTSGKVD